MSFRNIIIESPAQISLKNEQLVIKTGQEHSVAIEDISALLIENRRSVISSAALSELGSRGCAVFFCDEKHIPCAVLEPFHRYSRELPLLRAQLDMTEPQKKRLWQSVVSAKIRNQGKCLCFAGKQDLGIELIRISGNIKSGDPDNTEATAAQSYFTELFGPGFTRSQDNGYNSALNYGYAIIRGAIARQIAVYGLTPVLGIHHKSTLNSFNLADDLIEPFRPIIDLIVYTHFLPEDELLPEGKRLLFNSLNLDILFDSKHFTVAYTIELFVQSFVNALILKRTQIVAPELIELQMHRYE